MTLKQKPSITKSYKIPPPTPPTTSHCNNLSINQKKKGPPRETRYKEVIQMGTLQLRNIACKCIWTARSVMHLRKPRWWSPRREETQTCAPPLYKSARNTRGDGYLQAQGSRHSRSSWQILKTIARNYNVKTRKRTQITFMAVRTLSQPFSSFHKFYKAFNSSSLPSLIH